jgi:hypothetical protein
MWWIVVLFLLFPAFFVALFRGIFKAVLLTVIVVAILAIGLGGYRYASGYSFLCPDTSGASVTDPGPFC